MRTEDLKAKRMSVPDEWRVRLLELRELLTIEAFKLLMKTQTLLAYTDAKVWPGRLYADRCEMVELMRDLATALYNIADGLADATCLLDPPSDLPGQQTFDGSLIR